MGNKTNEIYAFNPGDLVQVRGMPAEKIYAYSSKIELHGQENYFVLSVDDRETQWPQSCCIPVENLPLK